MHLTICKLKRGHVSLPLAEQSMGSIFHGLPQTSKFRIPEDRSTPLILVGTGTGIAPHKGFLEKRLQDPEGKNGPVLGIFGYRTPAEHLYAEEFKTTYASPKNEWLAAYSRSGDDRKRVNTVILENAEKIAKLIDQGASILICGSHEMGRDVQAAFAQALEKGKGLASGEGENIIAKMKKETRYIADTYQQAH
jgi:cytochrome P450/NADPH-cytochrome P450 reductase